MEYQRQLITPFEIIKINFREDPPSSWEVKICLMKYLRFSKIIFRLKYFLNILQAQFFYLNFFWNTYTFFMSN